MELDTIAEMREFLVLLVHLVVVVVRLARPGGLRGVVAESVLVRHQLLILNRGRKRAPNLRVADRFIAGVCTLFICRARLLRSAIVLRPSTLLHLHRVLIKRKYRLLFSPTRRRRPGPKGPAKELIDAVVEMKRRNPRWGCPRIAQQIALAFGIEIDKDVVRRILSVHYRPESNGGGPSWLTFLGHAKDSLWSCDLFRCESSPDASSGLACTPASSTAQRCAGCSNERSVRRPCRNTSARTMIRCTDSISGKPISECSE